MSQDKFTYAHIDTDKMLSNIEGIRDLLSPKVKFMAVVKADAYGHGAKNLVSILSKHVDFMAVANLNEALELKTANVRTPIMILSEMPSSYATEIVENDLVQTIYTESLAKALSDASKKLGKKARVHLKVDSGMNRIGIKHDKAVELFEKIKSMPGIMMEGVFTHLAKAEEPDNFTDEQLSKFNEVTSKLDTKNLILHAANSAGALYHKDSHLDMVRIGLSMYGLNPPGGAMPKVKLSPALEFRTRVVYLKRVPKGTPISYGSTYITDKETTIATLPVGYADGLPRALSNKGQVLIRGKRFNIVGRVCMDLTLVDVDDESIKVGDDVTLIGSQGNDMISADEVAKWADTISYEIICGIGKRVPRVYS
jgi:alanine racemase